MNKYIEGFIKYMEDLEAFTEAEQDPHRRAILENYLRHHALELSGRDAEIFTPEMTVERPVYHMGLGTPDVVTIEGMEAVKSFYDQLNKAIVTTEDGQFAVADWGVASRAPIFLFNTGAELKETRGVEVDDPDAVYVSRVVLAQFWNYTADAKMIGEDVYELSPWVTEKCPPEDVVTLEMRNAVGRRFIKELV